MVLSMPLRKKYGPKEKKVPKEKKARFEDGKKIFYLAIHCSGVQIDPCFKFAKGEKKIMGALFFFGTVFFFWEHIFFEWRT